MMDLALTISVTSFCGIHFISNMMLITLNTLKHVLQPSLQFSADNPTQIIHG